MPYDSKVKNYLRLSGGFKQNADKKNIYVIKANGTVVSNKMTNIMNYQTEPGDAIVVPKKLRVVSAYKIFMETIDAVFKVVAIAVPIITLVITANK